MRVIVAEKKDVAAAISAAMHGPSKPTGASYQVDDTHITWQWGHLLTLSDPEDHDPTLKNWNMDRLPMTWPIDYKPVEQHKDHLAKVVALLKKADEIVHAGDPDAEGQRLVDEVLEYAGVTNTPTKRLLINDNNTAAIEKALAKMQDNADFHGLSQAALARGRCDQIYGYNLTRAYTLQGRNLGHDQVYSVGRVQTPILGLVVARDRANKGHSKQKYFTVTADVNLGDLMVTTTYQPSDQAPVDDKGRLSQKEFADQVVTDVTGKQGAVTSRETKDKQRPAPLPHNLLSLQAEAAGKWGYKPKKVLEITQALRDKYKAITYNRSDCRYLNDERHGEAAGLLDALQAVYPSAADADPGLKHGAFNSKKVTAHHGIIPTLSVPDLDQLTQEERNIYEMICTSYIAIFYPAETWRSTTLMLTIEGHSFKGTGRVDGNAGWTALYGKGAEDETQETRLDLERIQNGDSGTVDKATAHAKHTKPPALYTMKTLLQDLTRVAKYVTDPKVRELLLDKDADKSEEAGGIGTPATRDSHIETLFKRGYIIEKKKNIISTDVGQAFHDALPGFATKPDMTALWHEKQKQIEAGTLTAEDLEKEVAEAVADEISRLKSDGMNLKPADLPKCPNCETGHLKRRKGAKGFFWGCTNYPECKTTFPDKNGKPDQAAKKSLKPSEHACPECGKGLIRRPGKKKGSFWWGCSGFPSCKYTTFDKDGKPEIKQ